MPEYLNVREVRLFLRVHRNTVMNLVRSGRLKSYRVTNRLLFLREDVEALVQPNTKAS